MGCWSGIRIISQKCDAAFGNGRRRRRTRLDNCLNAYNYLLKGNPENINWLHVLRDFSEASRITLDF